ncbi:MAG: methyltransferase domain-containing protein [Caldilineaceae bacterium]
MSQRKQDAYYALGDSDHERRRLQLQAQLYEPYTRRLFQEAGILSGMKVLDIGCGMGDVTLLLAEMVGPNGTVIGIDNNPAILDAAKMRAVNAGYANVSFVSGDFRSSDLDTDFDAAVGRFILIYIGDTVSFIQRAVQHVKTGGVVAFQEIDFKGTGVSVPQSPLQQWLLGLYLDAFERARIELYMGYKLRPTFIAAGLPTPKLQFDALIGGGPDWLGYELIAESTRSLLPFMIKSGVTTAEEMDIDTLEARFRNEVVSMNAVATVSTCIGAWATKP